MSNYFEFEISLPHAKPRIWRRFLPRKTRTFQDLHKAIQDACGWENHHLFEFRMGGRMGKTIAGMPDEEIHEQVGQLKTDYRQMREMFFEDPPSFENILEKLKTVEDKINTPHFHEIR